VWLEVKLYGAAKLRAALSEKRALAIDAARRIAAIPGVAMDAPPQLSLFAFHLDWAGATPAARNAATRDLMERVTRRGRVMITGCEVDGRALARVCVLSFRTRQAQIDTLVDHVAEESAGILRGASAGAPAPRR
jgi:aromatic-L-amino-acid decarboxylase